MSNMNREKIIGVSEKKSRITGKASGCGCLVKENAGEGRVDCLERLMEDWLEVEGSSW